MILTTELSMPHVEREREREREREPDKGTHALWNELLCERVVRAPG